MTININAAEKTPNGTWGGSFAKSWRLEVTIHSIILDDGNGHIIIFPGIDISTPLGVFCLGLIIFVIVIVLLLVVLLVKRRRSKTQ